MDCIFCKIINKEVPSYLIYEDEYTYAFLDIAEDIDGHTIVIPKKHVENILDCDNETLSHVMDTVRLISKHYVEDLGYDGIVYVPEYSTWKPKEDYVDQAMWERNALTAASVIVFWLPRDLETMPGFTTNVEFGYWLPSKKVIYGRPDGAPKIKYLDWLYELDYGVKACNDLMSLLESAVNKLDQK